MKEKKGDSRGVPYLERKYSWGEVIAAIVADIGSIQSFSLVKLKEYEIPNSQAGEYSGEDDRWSHVRVKLTREAWEETNERRKQAPASLNLLFGKNGIPAEADWEYNYWPDQIGKMLLQDRHFGEVWMDSDGINFRFWNVSE